MLRINPKLEAVYSHADKTLYVYNVIAGKEYRFSGLLYYYLNFISKCSDEGEEIAFNIIVKKYGKTICEKFKEELYKLEKNGILTRSRSAGIIREENKDYPLRTIQIEITKRCNLKCKHCYVEVSENMREMNTQEILAIIKKASHMGVHSIDITGGEPLLRDDLRIILQAIYDYGMHCTLFTNGTLIDDDMIAFLKELPIFCVRISIDGIKKSTHEFLRNGSGCYEKSISAIRRLKELGINVESGTVVHQGNINEIEEMIYFFENDLEIKYHIDTIVPTGRAIENAVALGNPFAEYSTIMKKFILSNGEKNNKKEHTKRTNLRYCGIGNNFLFIDAYGNIKLCPSLQSINEYDYGNIKESQLEDIWSRIFIMDDFQCENISSCLYAKECRGGCRSRSYLSTGRINAPDLVMCGIFMNRYG